MCGPRLCGGGRDRSKVHSMYRAGWGQSVRTEHHLALSKRGAGWCFELDLDLDLS
jgi:hypothetical protein